MPSKLRGPVPVLVATLAIAGGATPAVAAQPDAREVARAYLSENAQKFGVKGSDFADLEFTSVYKTAGLGVTHVNINQRFRDLEVFGGQITVNVADDGSVLFAGGAPVSLATVASDAQSIDAASAVDKAALGLKLERPAKLRVMRRTGTKSRTTVLSGGGISREPIEATLGWKPTAGGLRLAWRTVIDDSEDAHLWNAAVDAKTGALLSKDDWTSHDRVSDLKAHLQRTSKRQQLAPAFQPAFLAASPEPVLDGSSYRVFAWPNESPNDAGRTLVSNPADSKASPFGWHDTNESTGPEYLTTQGNNVHAYLDQDANNAPDFGSSPSGGSKLRFDFPMDLTQHAQNYRAATVANLFYVNNMIHDVLYRYGFDDPSGNFQSNNYDRGGGEGDYVRAEAQDGNGTNNANFSTPAADSGTPRMQMYLWPGNQLGPQNAVTIEGGATYGATWARFGPAPTTQGLPGRTLVYGGTGCSDIDYPVSRPDSNWIAVVDGGTTACSYLKRVEVAQSLNADAVVVAHNATGNAPVLTGLSIDEPVVIPAVAVNQADGTAIKALIAAGPAPKGNVAKHPNHTGIRDGDIENGIIIHEYGHGVSNRLTGGPKTQNCLSGNEQAGEGWSDYLGTTLLLDPRLDNPQGPRGMGPYALFQANRQAAGIRPRPYSRDMTIQPFTYDSIKTGQWLNGASLALPHGLGHGWAATLWDMTWDLIDKHGYNANLYGAWNTGGNNRSLQYVIDGLKLQGCGPGLVVARDAIIAGASRPRRRGRVHDLGGVRAPRPRLQRGAGDHGPQRQHRGVRHAPGLQAQLPVPGAGGTRAQHGGRAGSTVDLRFTHDGYRGLDVLAENQPYSRLVDCTTLATVNPGQTVVTPRPYPDQGAGHAVGRHPRRVHVPVADRGRLGRHLPRAGRDGRLRPPVPARTTASRRRPTVI